MKNSNQAKSMIKGGLLLENLGNDLFAREENYSIELLVQWNIKTDQKNYFQSYF